MNKLSNGFLVVLTLAFIALPDTQTRAQVVASDLTGSTSTNLTSYTNPYTDAFTSAGDGFQKYRRGVSATIPFSVLDDSLASFPSDSLGIIDDNNLDEFFGVTDTVNGDTSGPVSATWVFDITGAADLALSIDMGAMGDFEASDTFVWNYSIDGGPTEIAFANSVDESTNNIYTLAGGSSFDLNDPMTMQGEILNNVLQTYSTLLAGTGSSLTLTLTASTNGRGDRRQCRELPTGYARHHRQRQPRCVFRRYRHGERR
jgi:hypothetical protein